MNLESNSHQKVKIEDRAPQKPFKPIFPTNPDTCNWDYEYQESTKNLPIHVHHKEILHKIMGGKVCVISGETGCGKSTQVPQYLY